MSRAIALFNQAGGVGKSTLTMNLGYHKTLLDQRVLLVDMDLQASLTVFMGLEPSELDKTVYQAILIGEPMPIHPSLHNMDLVTANINLSGAELELVVADMRDVRLKEALKPLRKQYDFILEDLNPLEETEGILQLLALKLNQSSEAVIALLNAAAHPERNSVDNFIHSPEWQVVVEVFTTVGKFTPESFRTNRLPLLNFSDEIKEALRQGRLSYTKARAIARVKDQLERQELLDAAITEDLSLNEIKDRIKSLLSAKRRLDEGQPPSLESRMDKAIGKIKKSKIWDDPKKSGDWKSSWLNWKRSCESLHLCEPIEIHLF
jgi:hypothetical protein